MLSRKEEAYLSIARYVAKRSQSRQKHGAVVVRGGSVLGMGYNKDRNHPSRVSPEHIKTHCSRHAELEAIRDAKWNVKGAVLYVARVNSKDEDRNSKPCMLCEKIIIETEIKKVIYTRSSNGN